MGKLIDADKLEYTCNSDECGMLTGCNHCQYNIITEDEIDKAPTVDAIPRADYENRLKADMVAMLTEFSMKIGEIEEGYTEFDDESKRSLTMIPLESVERLIDGEINKLKGDSDGD